VETPEAQQTQLPLQMHLLEAIVVVELVAEAAVVDGTATLTLSTLEI
jgi:hypothetical protein